MAQQSIESSFSLAAENKLRVEQAARAANQSLTDFVAAAVVERAEEVLQRQEHIRLSERDFEQFVQLMTTDAEPTETALQEAAEFKQGHIYGPRYRW